MLVRKYKCPSCGGNKTDEISTGYVYCDYCSSLIDFDMEKMTEESSEVFSAENDNTKKQQIYTQKLQELASHIKTENADGFVTTQCEIHTLEFDLFPKRFSPKIKQNAFRQRLLDYYKSYWSEKIAVGYFNENKETQKMFSELNTGLKFSYEGGKCIPEYDENFNNYIEKMDAYIKTSIDENMQMECMEKYPEPVTSRTKDVMYKQSMNMVIQMYDTDTIKKLIEKFGFKSEFVEIEDISQIKTKCFVCNSELTIPEGSKQKVCETCGTTNDIENRQVVCPGCAAPFSLSESSACPYCGSVMQTIGIGKNKIKEIDVQTEEIQTEIKIKEVPKEKNKGFFGKLFG
ncbi:MAG: hypothetical protein L3J35_05665 [Bacteroidales bacterium]|nr:hypothetical protein [Bacteroidales bacterium]